MAGCQFIFVTRQSRATEIFTKCFELEELAKKISGFSFRNEDKEGFVLE
jgi:hypothetical protein